MGLWMAWEKPWRGAALPRAAVGMSACRWQALGLLPMDLRRWLPEGVGMLCA